MVESESWGLLEVLIRSWRKRFDSFCNWCCNFFVFSFFSVYLFVWREQRERCIMLWGGCEEWVKWHSASLSAIIFCLHIHPMHLQSCTLIWYYSIGVCSVSFCKACLSYFAFYFTLYYSWTHHSSRGSCFLSREWQITPSGSHSLWSPLYVAATIIPCTTFKHIPFALQFVQPGIITTALNPLFPPILLHPSGSALSLAFSTPSREAFCVFYFYLFIYFMSSLLLFWQRSKVPKHESYLPPPQPRDELYTYQGERSCCWVCSED